MADIPKRQSITSDSSAAKVVKPKAEPKKPKTSDCNDHLYASFDEVSRNIHQKMKIREDKADPGIIEHSRANKLVLEKRLEDNDKELLRIYNNGLEFITNIRAVNDVLMVKRTEQETAYDEEMDELINAKMVECKAQLDVVLDRFAELKEDNSPELHERISSQKRRIEKLWAIMDEAIAKQREEYNRLNQVYENAIILQQNDCYCVYMRMEGHLNAMRKSYSEYLNIFKNTVLAEREKLHLTEHLKWEEMHKQNEENLDSKHKVEEAKKAFYDAEMHRIRFDHKEVTQAARIRLEKDEQSVYADLQQLRVNCMMNAEKFDYNYQILTKKGEENVTIRNQQKRRLAQMREQILELQKEIDDIQKNYDISSTKCNQEVVQFHSGFMELDKRADRYAKINEDKFSFAWTMNEDEANALLQRCLDVDKVLFQQRLGINWTPPTTMPINKEDMPSYKRAMDILHNQSQSEIGLHCDISGSKRNSVKIGLSSSKNKFAEQMLADTRVLRIILRRIAAESDPLFVSKLEVLLSPYISAENLNIILLDNVFKALGIENMKDVSSLIKHFAPYACCTVCSERFNTQAVKPGVCYSKPQQSDDATNRTSNVSSSLPNKSMLSNSLAYYLDTFENNQPEVELIRSSMSFNPPSIQNIEEAAPRRSEFSSCQRHTFAIETGIVFTALRDYMHTCMNMNARIIIGGIGASTDSTPMSDRLSCVRKTIPRLLSYEDIDMFWRRYREVFTEERRKLWDVLEKCQKEYLRVLQKRDQLDTECEYLRQQNRELQIMIAPYLQRQAVRSMMK